MSYGWSADPTASAQLTGVAARIAKDARVLADAKLVRSLRRVDVEELCRGRRFRGPPVADEAALLALDEKPRALEVGEVGGDGGRRQLQDGGHLADAQLALPHHGDEPLTDGVGEGLVGVDGSGEIAHFVITRIVAKGATRVTPKLVGRANPPWRWYGGTSGGLLVAGLARPAART